jgi:hypothetical protein
MENASLTLKNCHFDSHENFLGHIILKDDICTNLTKIEKVKKNILFLRQIKTCKHF